MASALLAERLRDTLDRLDDPVGRRRWGRAIDYYSDRLSNLKHGTEAANVARDVLLMLLPGKNGLRTNAPMLSQAAVTAVARLEEECRRIVSEDPVCAFGIGLIEGGRSPQAREFHVFWHEVRDAEDDIGATFTLAPIYHLAGRFFEPEGIGVRSSRVHAAERLIMVGADVPSQLMGQELHAFLRRTLDDAVQRVELAIRKRKLPWSTDAQRQLLDRLPAVPHSGE